MGKEVSTVTAVTIPKPPFPLTLEAAKFYYDICNYLISDQAFFAQDFVAVALFCDSLDMYIKVRTKLKKPEDCVEQYKNGSNINGYFTLRKQLRQELKDLMPDLAIGIKSREKVNIYVNAQLGLFDQNVADPWADHVDEKPQLGKVIDI